MDQFRPGPTLATDKFRDPDITAGGEQRARVALTALDSLWFNTGSLCNITCVGCYMDSSPKNDNLAYLTLAEVEGYLQELDDGPYRVSEIGLTGGEPMMNPDVVKIIGAALDRGYRVLVLTNAMKPLTQRRRDLLALSDTQRKGLVFRVSLDHYTEARHDELRGEGAFAKALEGVDWLVENEFSVNIAGRTLWREEDDQARRGYGALFDGRGIPVDADDPAQLVLFPEMDEQLDVPEITTGCWNILGIQPDAMMCAHSRMVIKRKNADQPVVVPCTLLPYDRRFEMGRRLADAMAPVALNHPHCARFCVLGGGSCSVG